MEPLDVVKQTGTTIIFEEFDRDEDKMNLATLLTRDAEEIPLERFAQALMGKDSELVVKSFAEFIEKFSPTIYETTVTTEDGSARFVYSLDKPKYECTEIKLKDHAFYKMIMNLIDRKANSDKDNFEFPYDDLKKALSPEAEMEECRQIRRDLFRNVKEYYKLTDCGANLNSEADRYAQNVLACRRKIVEKYQGGPLALLPLLLLDKQMQLEAIKTADEEAPQYESGETKEIPCEYAFDDQGKLKLIKLEVSDDAQTKSPQENNNAQLVEVVRKDFEKYAPAKIQNNSYIANTVVNVFVPGGAQLSTQDKGELEAEKKELQDIYKTSFESFAKAVAGTVERFAGVKSFFDHASCDGELPQDVSVIISNCKVDAILNNPVAKERFKKYFGALSYERDVDRIWFGVIPAVSTDEGGWSKTEKVLNPYGDFPLESESPAEKKAPAGLVALDTVKEMLSILTEAKIMTFVNYKAGESTGFIGLSDTRINQYHKDFESVNSEYAVFVYPNFTILPKEKGVAQIGTEYNAEYDEEVGAYITLPGVYLDASYVACGMTVGIQNYKLLEKKGYYVNPKYPCVRFDLEDPENSKRVTTKLNRETTTETPKQIQDSVMKDRFGFVFANDKIEFDGKVLNNSYVLNARSLKKEADGKYKALYKTLVKNLAVQVLHAIAGFATRDTVNRFLKEYADTWKADNKTPNGRSYDLIRHFFASPKTDDGAPTRRYDNRILRENESIALVNDNELAVFFDKEPDLLGVVIEDSVNDEE